MRTPLLSTPLGRRAFIGASGVAVAGAVGAACAREEFTPEPYAPSAQAQEGNGHDAAPDRGAGRPEPEGELATIYDAVLPALAPEPVKNIVIDCIDADVEVAGGIKLAAWTFDGKVPGTVVRVRQGDTINFTLTNSAAIGHSMDFHAAETPWNTNYRTIVPGDSLTYQWRANWPGVFMYHCGTGPVLEHIANGMYGAIVVDPAEAFTPAREYVLVQSEFYLKEGENGAWAGDSERMAAVQPDFVVFNGAASQYTQQPLPAAVGERIRLYVVNAGPTLFSAFHVIGAVFDRVYADGNPLNVMRGISTWTIPPGGGATFELVIPEAGQYPFVTHSFAYTGLGAVGLLDVA